MRRESFARRGASPRSGSADALSGSRAQPCATSRPQVRNDSVVPLRPSQPASLPNVAEARSAFVRLRPRLILPRSVSFVTTPAISNPVGRKARPTEILLDSFSSPRSPRPAYGKCRSVLARDGLKGRAGRVSRAGPAIASKLAPTTEELRRPLAVFSPRAQNRDDPVRRPPQPTLSSFCICSCICLRRSSNWR
jgi:hypothetical protein